jgi:hypothetical protein
MKNFKYLTLSAMLGISLSAQALAEDLYVIANPATSVTAADVREIFLGEKQFAGSVKIIPVDNAAIQGAFLSQVLKMDVAKYSATWTKKAFRDGLSPPALRSGGDADVTSFVKSTAGAVGYVATKPAAGVTLVEKY